MSDYPDRVQKYGHLIPVDADTLLILGMITEDQARELGWTPPPPVPRLRALRWALDEWWYAHRPHLHTGPCERLDP